MTRKGTAMKVNLPTCAAKLANCCAGDYGYGVCRGTRVTSTGKGTVNLQATNGRVLAIMDVCTDDELPLFDKIVDRVEFYIAAFAAHVRKKSAMEVDISNSPTTGEKPEIRFPATEEIFPKSQPSFSCKFGITFLRQILEVAAEVCNDDEEVSISFFQDAPNRMPVRPVRIDCENKELGIKLRCLIVPKDGKTNGGGFSNGEKP